MHAVLNRASRFWYQRSLGLLLIRIAAGVVFVHHGWMKFGSIANTEHFFMTLGLPAWVAIFVAGVEVIGGVMLILGICTRVAGVALGIDMFVAIFITGFSRGLSPHEFEFVLMMLSFAIALAGSGKFSLFAMECQQCGGMVCKDHV